MRLRRSPLLTSHGVVAGSVENTGEQWDWPNLWAPLQHAIVEGLRLYGHQHFSRDIAARFLTKTFRSYLRHGAMFEKYAMQSLGQMNDLARGGEYEVQVAITKLEK